MQADQTDHHFLTPPATLSLPEASSFTGITLLPNLAPVLAQGPEAASFLHSQISQDALHLPSDAYRLGGYCSVKGRLQASFLLFQPQADQLVMLADASLLPAWLKRMQMFVMRAKVTLQDARNSPSHWLALGVLGEAQSIALFGDKAAALPTGGLHTDDAMLLRLPDVLGQARWIWVGPADAAQSLLAKGTPMAAHAWDWLNVMSGIPHITSPTVDQFVPQMVNYEVVGGINFQKGCYPGQEVVARSQYRGTVKRRLFVLHCPDPTTPMMPMQEIFSTADPEQAAGVVVNAAPMPNGMGWSALAELKLAFATPDMALHLSALDGPKLILGTLPYVIPTEDDA
jgi:tRNA-modifying protein YgfZ